MPSQVVDLLTRLNQALLLGTQVANKQYRLFTFVSRAPMIATKKQKFLKLSLHDRALTGNFVFQIHFDPRSTCQKNRSAFQNKLPVPGAPRLLAQQLDLTLKHWWPAIE